MMVLIRVTINEVSWRLRRRCIKDDDEDESDTDNVNMRVLIIIIRQDCAEILLEL